MTLTTVTSRQPALVIRDGDGPGVLVNRDLTNVVYVNDEQAYDPADVNASIHDPLVGIPYDGTANVYALAPAGQSVIVDYIKNAQNWQPSPAQAAAQINALGLAKDTTLQGTTTAVNGTTTAVGGTTSAVQDTRDAALSRQNVHPNPFFTKGSSAGWSALSGVTLAIVQNQPAGAPHTFAAQCTPGGANQFPGFGSAQKFPCQPGQLVGTRVWYNVNSLTNAGEQARMFVNWFQADGVTPSAVKVSDTVIQIPIAGQWIHGHMTAYAPSDAFSYSYGFNLNGNGVNVPASDVFFLEDFTAHVSIPGMPASSDPIGGVPIVVNPITIDSAASIALTNGVQVVRTIFNVNQPSIEGAITVTTAGATLTQLAIQFIWLLNGVQIDSDNINILVANGVGHSIRFRSPSKGNQLQVAFLATGNNSTISNYAIIQTSRLFEHLWIRTLNLGGGPGAFPGGPAGGTAGADAASRFIAGIVNTNVGIAASTSFILPMYCGKASLHLLTASLTSDMTVHIEPLAGGIGSGARIVEVRSGANGFAFQPDVQFPSDQCQITLTNGNAAAQNLSASVIEAEY